MGLIKTFRMYRAWSDVQKKWKAYMKNPNRAEPVVLADVVKSIAVLLALAGYGLTSEQVDAVVVVAGAVIVIGGPLVAWFHTRRKVTPWPALQAEEGVER